MAKKILILAAVILLIVTACNPVSSVEKVAESKDQVCKDLVLFKTSVNKLQSESYADRNALEAQFSVVRQNFTNLVQSVANLASVKTDAFQQAANDLIAAYQNIPQESSVQDTLAAIKDPITQVVKVSDQLSTALQCKP
jgi:hypothetical protein